MKNSISQKVFVEVNGVKIGRFIRGRGAEDVTEIKIPIYFFHGKYD